MFFSTSTVFIRRFLKVGVSWSVLGLGLIGMTLSSTLLYGQSAAQNEREANNPPRPILFPSDMPAPYFPADAEIARAAEERFGQAPGYMDPDDQKRILAPQEAGIDEIDDLDNTPFGSLMPAAGGLSKNIWQPSSIEIIEGLLEVLKLPNKSPAMGAISQKLLLSFASMPSGKVIGSSPKEIQEIVSQTKKADGELLKRFINLRLNKLTERGNLIDLVRFLQNLPENILEPKQQNAETLLLGGDLIGACQMSQRANPQAKINNQMTGEDFVNMKNVDAEMNEADIFWLKMYGFCRALEEDNMAAQTALSILGDQNINDYVFFDLLNQLMESPDEREPFVSIGITALDPLNYIILNLLDQPINADLIETSPPLLISALVLNGNLSAESRLQAAVKSYLLGGVSSETLGKVYDVQEFTENEFSQAVRLAQFDDRPLADALLYQAASRQKLDEDKISILIEVWNRAALNNDMGRKAVLYKNILSSITPTSRLMNSAHHITRGLLLAGDVQRAVQWYDFARRGAAGGDAEATRALINIWPLITIAINGSDIPWTNDILNLWWNGQALLAPDNRNDKATLFYAIAEAFGNHVPEDRWMDLVRESPVKKMRSIPLGVWREIIRAVGENKPAQSIILSLIAMGADGPGSLNANGISTVIRLLRSFGLEQDARQVAIEALAANDF